MENELEFIRVLFFLSGAILTVGALRALAKDLRSGLDARDISIDIGMLALGLGVMILAGSDLF